MLPSSKGPLVAATCRSSIRTARHSEASRASIESCTSGRAALTPPSSGNCLRDGPVLLPALAHSGGIDYQFGYRFLADVADYLIQHLRGLLDEGTLEA
jgi:hypothetical protein